MPANATTTQEHAMNTITDIVHAARNAAECSDYCVMDAQDALTRLQRARTRWGVDAALQDVRRELAACRAAEATVATCADLVLPLVPATVAEGDDRAWLLATVQVSNVHAVRAVLQAAEELAARRELDGSALPVPGHGA